MENDNIVGKVMSLKDYKEVCFDIISDKYYDEEISRREWCDAIDQMESYQMIENLQAFMEQFN